MSNNNWKAKMSKPSKRKSVWSNKEKRWLSHEEEQELLRLLKEKQEKIKELTNGEDPQKFLANELAKSVEADALLKKDEDEPEASSDPA